MPNRGVNPVDPMTGKSKRGRPPKQQATTAVVERAPIEETVLDGSDQKRLRAKEIEKSEYLREMKKRISGVDGLEPPTDIVKRYPDNDFCWVPTDDTKRRGQYMNRFGYEPPEGAPIIYGDLQLMMRSKEVTRIHRQVEAEAAAAAMGQPAPSLEEKEAQQVSRSFAHIHRGELKQDRMEDRGFIEEPDKDDYDIRDHQREQRPKGAAGRGSKYWTGGLPG